MWQFDKNLFRLVKFVAQFALQGSFPQQRDLELDMSDWRAKSIGLARSVTE